MAQLEHDPGAGMAFTPFEPHFNAPIDLPDPPEHPQRQTLCVLLRDSSPPIWRRLTLPGFVTLDVFHRILQVSMGWSDSHLHRFWPSAEQSNDYFLTEFDQSEGDDGTPESGARIDQVLREPADAIGYEYDFGDSWEHSVTLETVENSADTSIMCTDGARACPPEDIGGIGFYNEVAAWLTEGMPAGGLAHMGFVDDAELIAWLPPDFDPHGFSAADTSAALSALGNHITGRTNAKFL